MNDMAYPDLARSLQLLLVRRTYEQQDKIQILAEFKEVQALKAQAEKRYKEIKEKIQKEIEAGKYGDFALAFEAREVREYVVPARTDIIVKVMNIGGK